MKFIVLPLFVLATLTNNLIASPGDNIKDSPEAIRAAIQAKDFKSLNVLRYAYQDTNSIIKKSGKIVVAEDGIVDESIKGACRVVQDLADHTDVSFPNFRPNIIIELQDDATNRLGFEQGAVHEFYIGSTNEMLGVGVAQRYLANGQIVYKNTFDELSLRATCGSYGHISVDPQDITNTLSIEPMQVNMFAEYKCGGLFGVGAKKHVKVTSCQF